MMLKFHLFLLMMDCAPTLSFFAVATYSPGLIVVCKRSMSCPWRGEEDFFVLSLPTCAKMWQNQGWLQAPWRVR